MNKVMERNLVEVCTKAGAALVSIYLDLLCSHRVALARKVLELTAVFGEAAARLRAFDAPRATHDELRGSILGAARTAGAIALYLSAVDSGVYEERARSLVTSCRRIATLFRDGPSAPGVAEGAGPDGPRRPTGSSRASGLRRTRGRRSAGKNRWYCPPCDENRNDGACFAKRP